MSYAVRNDGMGWRSVNGPDDVGLDETYSATVPPDSLEMVQTTQTALMEQAYSNAVAQDVSFTTGAGVTKTYQADPDSQDILNKTLNVCKTAGAVPDGFWWKPKDNTLVPFTLADLAGLASAMLDQGWAAFQKLTARKNSITAATTSAAVKAITW